MSKAGPPSDDFTIRKFPVYEESGVLTPQAKQLLAAFDLGSQPLTTVPPPQGTPNPVAARADILQKTEVDLGATPPPENSVKRGTLRQKLEALGEFAENHPWLTTGFVIASLLLLVTGYLTVQAFLGHDTISIFGAHPELGGGLSFMMIYYTVYIFNMCRRAALKDDLEAKLEAHTKELQTQERADLSSLRERISETINRSLAGYIDMEQLQRAETNNTTDLLTEAEQIKGRLENLRDKLFDLLRANLSQEDGKRIQSAIQEVCVAIGQGARHFGPLLFPPTTEVPSIYDLEITIPTQPTPVMEANQQKQASLMDRMVSSMKEIPQALRTPGSRLMYAGGISMCILAGVAVFFYFHGATNLYFFGSISLTTILPMAIYGMSLIYEGYNNATIVALEKELEEMAESGKRQGNVDQSNRQKLAALQKKVDATFSDISETWLTFLNSESMHLVEVKKVEEQVALAKRCEQMVRELSKKFADLPPAEATRVLQGPADGARLVAS